MISALLTLFGVCQIGVLPLPPIVLPVALTNQHRKRTRTTHHRTRTRNTHRVLFCGFTGLAAILLFIEYEFGFRLAWKQAVAHRKNRKEKDNAADNHEDNRQAPKW